MNFRTFIPSVFLFLVSNVFAQNRTYVGFELAATDDQLMVVDNGTDLKSVPLVEGLWGLNVRQEFNRSFFVEMGIDPEILF